jgi:glycosyltransferase involved in cell wall biosynthesis
MRVSVVVLTYNWPQALDMVLRALARQSVLPLEVIVSDDGSGPATRELMQRHAKTFPVRLVHLWQEDAGARMSRARNRGIAAAQGDYVVFLDGDMVAQRELIADHVEFAAPGCFVQGSRVLTDEECTQRMLATGAMELGFFARGIERRRHTLRNGVLRGLYGRPHDSSKGIKSCNWGFWRQDLLRINGFNEAMTGWGREDNELAARAFHAGLQRRDLRFGGQAVHLWHRTRKNVVDNPNDVVLADTRQRRLVRCEEGVDRHLAEFLSPPPDLRETVTSSV